MFWNGYLYIKLRKVHDILALERNVTYLTYSVMVNLDWPDIGGANWRHGEEPMLPFTNIHNALIQIEETAHPAGHTGVDAE